MGSDDSAAAQRLAGGSSTAAGSSTNLSVNSGRNSATPERWTPCEAGGTPLAAHAKCSDLSRFNYAPVVVKGRALVADTIEVRDETRESLDHDFLVGVELTGHEIVGAARLFGVRGFVVWLARSGVHAKPKTKGALRVLKLGAGSVSGGGNFRCRMCRAVVVRNDPVNLGSIQRAGSYLRGVVLSEQAFRDLPPNVKYRHEPASWVGFDSGSVGYPPGGTGMPLRSATNYSNVVSTAKGGGVDEQALRRMLRERLLRDRPGLTAEQIHKLEDVYVEEVASSIRSEFDPVKTDERRDLVEVILSSR